MGNALAAIAYLLGILGGIIAWLAGKDKATKFHGIQSVLYCIGAGIIGVALAILNTVLAIVAGIIDPSGALLGLVGLVVLIIFGIYLIAVVLVWLYLIYKGWSNEIYKLPVIGNLADQWSG